MMHEPGDWYMGFSFGHWVAGIAVWVIIILAIVVLIKNQRRK